MQTTHKILVVDDDRALRDLLVLCLEDKSTEIVTADDGLAALQELDTLQPTVIILDVNMPGMDGWTFLRELEQRKEEATSVILVSGDPQMEEQAAGLSIAGFLPKPFDLADLDCLIRKAMK